ncbi:MAG TPA: septal ring lytic transglycosylase RlpA family protein, partial [Thermoleophilaceae bacterium]|nr:septal ring lytic transglycosylase RlpA family protein [Thermoleophilaceae bacterium]
PPPPPPPPPPAEPPTAPQESSGAPSPAEEAHPAIERTGGVAPRSSPREEPAATPRAARRLTLAASRRSVRYGRAVSVRGRIVPAAAGVRVKLFSESRTGRRRYAGAARTDERGRYRRALRLTRSARLRAVADGGAESRRVAVGVRPLLRARIVGGPKPGGWSISAAGRLLPAAGGQRVHLQRRDEGVWRTVASSRTARSGRFSLDWSDADTGLHELRVRFSGSGVALASSRSLGEVPALRAATASYYGPGLYGNMTACGQTLTAETRGVAHPSLPCGTPVTLWYRGRSATVEVIDRGPYVPGRSWDLTAATARDLGFSAVDTIWVSH